MISKITKASRLTIAAAFMATFAAGAQAQGFTLKAPNVSPPPTPVAVGTSPAVRWARCCRTKV